MTLRLTPLVCQLPIIDKDGEIVRLQPKFAQRRWLDVADRQLNTTGKVRTITLKARQVGFSTVTAAYGHTLLMVKPNSAGLTMAHENDASEHLLSMHGLFYDEGPYRELYSVKHKASNHLSWVENRSSMRIATAGNKRAGRSKTLRVVHASEFGLWEAPTITWGGLRQAVPSRPFTMIAIESTAFGVGNLFHEMWRRAEAGDTEYEPIFVPWFHDPGYRASVAGISGRIGKLSDYERALKAAKGVDDDQLLWYRYCLNDLCGGDEGLRAQEYPCIEGSQRVGTDVGLLPIREIPHAFELADGQLIRAWLPKGEKPVVRLRTRLGYELTCTPDHPLFNPDTGEWVPAAQATRVALATPRFAREAYTIGLDDLPAVDRRVTIDARFGRWLGLFMGDGSVSNATISFVADAKDVDVVDEWDRLCWVLFGIEPQRRAVGTNKGGIESRFASKAVAQFLDDLDCTKLNTIGARKRRVCVPDVIWRSPKHVVREFLRGLFESDAFASPSAMRVAFFAKDPEFMRDVHLLLLGFGVTARLVVADKKGSDGHAYTGRQLEISGERAIDYYERIGFIGARKSAGRRDRPTMWRTAKRNVLADDVAEIVDAGTAPVYDLVTADHTFDASGIVVHNCDPIEAFQATGNNVFAEERLRAHYQPLARFAQGRLERDGDRVTFVPDARGPLKIFRRPADKDHGVYQIGADPARVAGRGDYACAQVINRRTLEQVAVFRQRIDAEDFTHEVFKLGLLFNLATVAPEVEGPGALVVGGLRALRYPNVWRTKKFTQMQGKALSFGWHTTDDTKRAALERTRSYVNNPLAHGIGLVIHDPTTFDEMRNYVQLPNGKFGNANGSPHDDTVMALAIACTTHYLDPLPPPLGTRMPFDLDEEPDRGDTI